MKKIYKISNIIFVTLICILCFCISAKADVKTGKCGSNCSYSYDTATGAMTISGTGEITSKPWMEEEYKNDIKTLTIKEGVTAIAVDYAFSQCNSLQTITLPESLKSIGKMAFAYCRNLRNLEMPAVEVIYMFAFYRCTSLEEVVLPDTMRRICQSAFRSTGIKGTLTIKKDIMYGECVYDACKVTKVVYEEGIKTIKREVSHTATLKTVKLPNSAVKIDSHAFWSCPGIQNIVIPKNMKTIGTYAFSSCKGLKSITIPQNVKTIERGAFFNVRNLKKIIIKSRKITSMGRSAFYIQNTNPRGNSVKTFPVLKIYVPSDKYSEYKTMIKGTEDYIKYISVRKW